MSQEVIEKVVDGIYTLKEGVTNGPRTIPLSNGGIAHRFMDALYTEEPELEKLTEEQVSALCRERAKRPNLITKVNLRVKQTLSYIVSAHHPNFLLEIGSGTTPAISPVPDGLRYILADSDENIVKENNLNKKECVAFSRDHALPYSDHYFDMIIAAFVFHFNIYDEQISELARCLAHHGVIITNVYRRTPESRSTLCAHLKAHNLSVEKITDTQLLCRDHEYWIIGRQGKSNFIDYKNTIVAASTQNDTR